MKNKNTLIIVLLSAIVIVGVIWYISNLKSPNTKYNWDKTFKDSKNQPYDFGLFKKILNHHTNNQFIEVKSNLNQKLNTIEPKDSITYLFIGKQCYLRHLEIDSLLGYAEKGNDVVFIAEELPDTLMKALTYYGKQLSLQKIDENKVKVNFDNLYLDSFTFQFRFRNKKMDEVISWVYFNDISKKNIYNTDYYASRFIELSKLNGKPNFVKFKVGNGFVYVHTNPILFTNYFLNDSIGFKHLGNVFSEINVKSILYDVESKNYKQDAEKLIRQSDTPLSFILKQPALKMAWYIIIIAVLLFFLFKAKRNQRIIPVIDQKRNTSLQFTETISRLFFYTANHKKVAEIKMNIFTAFVRSKLGIPTHNVTDETYKAIAIKAKVKEEDVKNIFNYYNIQIASNLSIDDKELIKFHQLLQLFNQQFYNKNK